MLSPARDRYITQTKNDNITHSNTKVNYSLVNKNKHPTSNCHSNLDAYMTGTHQLTKESGTVHSISREASVLLSPARDRYISQSKNDNTTNTEKKVNKTLVSNNKRSANYLSFYYTNATSLVNKQHDLELLINKLKEPDLICITETWFDSDKMFNINNYQCFETHRSTRKGGGVAIYVKSSINAYDFVEQSNKTLSSTACEQTWCQLTINKQHILIGCLYRPPTILSTDEIDNAINLSIARAAQLCDNHKFDNVIIAGDFNYPLINWPNDEASVISDPSTNKFLDFINSSSMSQFVHCPTFKNNTLDLVFAYHPNSVTDIKMLAPLGNTHKNGLHSAVTWKLRISEPIQEPQSKPRLNYDRGAYSNLSETFRSVNWNLELNGIPLNNQYEIIRKHYNKACMEHIPLMRLRRKNKTRPKWMNKQVKKAISTKYKLFSCLNRCSTTAPNKPAIQKLYNKATRVVKRCVRDAVIEYEKSIVQSCKKDQKPLWDYINSQKKFKNPIKALIDNTGNLNTNPVSIANTLNEQFFSVFSTPDTSDCPPLAPIITDQIFEMNPTTFSLESVTLAFSKLDIRKPAGLDGFHPRVLRECCHELALPFSIIFSNSFKTGSVPDTWHDAVISPIFKKGDRRSPT